MRGTTVYIVLKVSRVPMQATELQVIYKNNTQTCISHVYLMSHPLCFGIKTKWKQWIKNWDFVFTQLWAKPHHILVSTGQICGGGGLYKSHMTTSETEAQTTQRQYWATSTRIENTMDREIGILGGTHPAERWTFHVHDVKTSECHFIERCKGMVSDTPPSKNDPKYCKSNLGCISHASLPFGAGYTPYAITLRCLDCAQGARLSNMGLRMSSPPS